MRKTISMAEVNDIIITLEDVTSDNPTDDSETLTTYGQPDKDFNNESYPESLPNESPLAVSRRSSKQVFITEQVTASVEDIEGALDTKTLLIASTLVQDAKKGRTLNYILGDKYVRSYNLYNQRFLRYPLYICLALNLALAIFENPAQPEVSVPYWGTMIIEVICLIYFAARLFHAFYFHDSKVFIKDKKNIIIAAVIIVTLIDILCYILWINLAPDTHPVRWSRCLRPLFIINFPDGKQIQRAFRNIRRTIPDIFNVFLLFSLIFLLFGLAALKLFYKRNIKYSNGDPYFTNYLDIMWDLYVLVTTSNNPDVMMPAYERSSWFAIFFVVYLIFCLYIFMSIMLATIYNNFKNNLKNEVKAAVHLKRKKLARAFKFLSVRRGNEEVITHSRWKELMGIILPNRSATYTDLLMKILDNDNKNVLGKKDFFNLSDLLNIPLTEVKDRQTFLAKHIPKIYNHRFSEYFKIGVRHKYFHYAFDLLVIVNAVFIAVDLSDSDWFFLPIFTVEIMCKLYVCGGHEFFQHFWNIFNLLVIGSAFVISIAEKIVDQDSAEFRIFDILVVLRMMRLITIFGRIQRFKVILQTLINIRSSIGTYGGVLFMFYYFFAIIGMEAFGGYITFYGYDTDKNSTSGSKLTLFCGNINLNNTQFNRDGYCKNNFNNFANAIVVLFELTVVNQWHVITSGFVHVTNKAARIYFFAFHICCVVIILNIFTAFILEAFMLEFNLQSVQKLESVVETKIKKLGLGIGMKTKSEHIQGTSGRKIESIDEDVLPDTKNTNGDDEQDLDTDTMPDLSKEGGLKFHLEKKSRKKVEVLLQQMFEDELRDLKEIPFDDLIKSCKLRRKFTLENIT